VYAGVVRNFAENGFYFRYWSQRDAKTRERMKKIKSVILLFSILSIISSCESANTDNSLVSSYLIASLIDEVYPDDTAGKMFLIEQASDSSDLIYGLENLVYRMSDEDSLKIIQDFKVGFSFLKDFNWDNPIKTYKDFRISSESISSVKNPDGLFQITNPVNIKDDVYLIYIAIYCGNFCSSGNIVRLKRINNVFQVEDIKTLWVG